MKNWEKAIQKAMGNRKSYGHKEYGAGKVSVHYYDTEGIDPILDGILVKAMAGVGYKRNGSGYFFPESKRDIGFERV